MKNKDLLDKVLIGKQGVYKKKQDIFRRLQDGFLVIISNVMPGFPKKNGKVKQFMESVIAKVVLELPLEKKDFLENDAGLFYFFESRLDPLLLKRRAVHVESSSKFYRLLDIDCYHGTGFPISRISLNLPQRKCLICNNDAAQCLLNFQHPTHALRASALKLIDEFKF